MGRRKIAIAPIQDDRNRQVTFLKRKNGLFKKAYELGVLCSADVAVIVFNANGKLFEFHSGDMDTILLRYSHYSGPPHEKRGPEDYNNKDLAAAKKGMGGKMTTLSDEDEEEEDEDTTPQGSSGVKAISKGKQAIKAAQERKAKEASLSRAASEDVEHAAPSLSRSNSQNQYNHYQQQHPDSAQQNGFPPQQAPPNAQQIPYPGAAAPGQPPPPGATPQAFGLLPFGSGPPNVGNLPTFPGGLPMPPSFPFGTGLPGWPGQPQLPGGHPSTAAGSGGVPAWFGAPNPHVAAGLAPGLGGFPNGIDAMQMLQQTMGSYGGGPVPGWPPGMGDPNAALQFLQQQQQQPQHPQQQQPPNLFGLHQQQPPPPQHLQSQQPPHASPVPAQTLLHHVSSPPQPAPMYGSPAAMSFAGSPESLVQTPGQHSTPGSTSSHLPSSSHHPRPHPHPHLPPSRQNSLNTNKPRLSVSIPEEAAAVAAAQQGLVTAGGASILGAGLGGGGGGAVVVKEPEDKEEERGQATAVPKSAFAADLLPSPFYPGQINGVSSSSSTTVGGVGLGSIFTWPTTTTSFSSLSSGPAPMLGEAAAPDLLRRASQEGEGMEGEDGVLNRLKRGSVELEEGIDGLEVRGSGEMSGAEEGGGEGEEGRVRKKRG